MRKAVIPFTGARVAEIAYRESGSGRPVLLIHGLGGSSTSWHYQLERLALTRRVIAIDLPGHGASPRPAGRDLTPVDAAALLGEFIRRVVGEPVDLVGHSMGGALATMTALRHSGWVRSLVLVASAGLGDEMPFFLRVLCVPGAGRIAEVVGPRLVSLARVSPRVRRHLTGGGDDPIFAPVVHEAFEHYGRGVAVRTFVKALRTGARFSGQKRSFQQLNGLTQLNIPTLVIWGRQDAVLPLAHGLRAVERIGSRARLAVLDCGHSPMLEAAARVTELLSEFLDPPMAAPVLASASVGSPVATLSS